MPNGKPAGVPCVHLDVDMNCLLFGDERRPALCDAFTPEWAVCADNRERALAGLAELELLSLPDAAAVGGDL
jgi:hypothetical protein